MSTAELSSAAGPLLTRLRAHAGQLGAAGDPHPSAGDPRVAPEQVAFWQSPIVRAAINRRISGDPELGPETYFVRRHGAAIVAPRALSLRASDAKLELALVETGGCKRVTILDDERRRLRFAEGRVPLPLRDRIDCELGAFEQWDPSDPLGAIVCRSFLHRRADLEQVLDRMLGLLAPGGLLFVEDFVGPARFQWTDAQLEVINRLLAWLPDELLIDLHAGDGSYKRSVERPSVAGWEQGDRTEALRSDEILALLDERLERVEVRLSGGAVFHQLFSRIMGNFAARPELVGLIMELDAILTDLGALGSDYVWGVWRAPSAPGGASTPV